jgi:hypothetical protein
MALPEPPVTFSIEPEQIIGFETSAGIVDQ